MPKVKTIFIDWSKTLSYSLFWEQLSNPSHPSHDAFSKIEDALFKTNRHLIKPWMRGELSTAAIVTELSKATGLTESFIFQELVISCQNMKFADPKIPLLLKELSSQGVKLVIATDNMDVFRRYTIPAMGLDTLFDDYLISCELKCQKADFVDSKPLFFIDYLSDKHLDYQDVVLLDDCLYKPGTYDRISFPTKHIKSPNDLVVALSGYVS